MGSEPGKLLNVAGRCPHLASALDLCETGQDMLKKRTEQIRLAVRMGDLLIIGLAFFLSYYLRGSFWTGPLRPLPAIDTLNWMLGASLLIHFLVCPYFGFYESLRLKSLFEIFRMILKAAFVEFFVLGTFVFLIQAKSTSRYFFFLFLGIKYFLLLLERLGARVLLASIRRRGFNFRQVLIAGTGRNAGKVVDFLSRNRSWGYLACGFLSERSGAHAESIQGLPVFGSLADLERVVRAHPVDEVFFALDRFDPAEIQDQILLCENLGIHARFSFALFDLSRSKLAFSQLDGLPILTFHTTLRTPLEVLVKRALDILIALVGLVITGLLLPWIAWRIRRESPGPIFFKQPRVGENGRRFKCYKFRTMRPDADALKEKLRAQNQMEGPIFKIENDPRVTPFGAFLRRTSLDEFPQFLNVLRGDMSVVGTRPPTPEEVAEYSVEHRRRLSIRPGLTGLWQVSGRSQITRFEDILRLDLDYIDRWSLWLDVRIIARTLWVTLFRKGAV